MRKIYTLFFITAFLNTSIAQDIGKDDTIGAAEKLLKEVTSVTSAVLKRLLLKTSYLT